jgi:hypothetical protein
MDAISNGKGANTPCGVTRPLEQLKPFLGIRRFLMVWPRRFVVIFRSHESARNEQPMSNLAVLVTAARLQMLLNLKSPIRAAARDGER